MAENNSINFRVLDEDTMSSDSNTAVATQQSIKAYVDAQVVSGSMVGIGTGTASASATIDFTGLDATYPIYAVYFDGVLPVSDGAIHYMRIGTGATPTWVSSSSYQWGVWTVDTSGARNGTGSSSDTQIELGFGGNGNASDEHVAGWVWVANPADTGIYTTARYDSLRVDTSGVRARDSGIGQYNANTAVTALRFLFSTGNISVGNYYLYGVLSP